MAAFRFIYILIAAILAVTTNCVLTAQTDERSSITGTVLDQRTREPIENVNIIVEGTQIGATTRADGSFIIENVPPGSQKLIFSHINYVPYSYTQFFAPDISEDIDIELVSRTIIFEQVEVFDTLPGHRATGYHFTRQDIDNTAAVSFGQLIQALVPRARIQESGGNLYIQLQLRQSIYQRHERMRDPYPLIIINGMVLGTSPIGLGNIAPASQIDNFRVIRPPESQSVFGPEAAHGVIIIETRTATEEDTLLESKHMNMVLGGLAAFLLAMIVLF